MFVLSRAINLPYMYREVSKRALWHARLIQIQISVKNPIDFNAFSRLQKK